MCNMPCKSGDIYVLEVNPRASRTVPFVAKAIGLPVAATRRARRWRAKRWPSLQLKKPDFKPHRREGSRDALRAVPGRRHDPRPRNALDRRSDGPRHDISAAPSPRARSQPAPSCRSAEPSSSRSRNPTRNSRSNRRSNCSRWASRSSRRAARPNSCRPRASKCALSTRCWRAGRISSMR